MIFSLVRVLKIRSWIKIHLFSAINITHSYELIAKFTVLRQLFTPRYIGSVNIILDRSVGLIELENQAAIRSPCIETTKLVIVNSDFCVASIGLGKTVKG